MSLLEQAKKFRQQADSLEALMRVVSETDPRLCEILEAFALLAVSMEEICIMKSGDKDAIEELLKEKAEAMRELLAQIFP